MLYLSTMFRRSRLSPCKAVHLAHSSGVWPAGQGNACVQGLCVCGVCVRVERAERAVGVVVWACIAPMGMVGAGRILLASLGATQGSPGHHFGLGEIRPRQRAQRVQGHRLRTKTGERPRGQEPSQQPPSKPQTAPHPQRAPTTATATTRRPLTSLV